MKKYNSIFKEANLKGNFYAQKSAIKMSFKMLSIVEKVQKYFENLKVRNASFLIGTDNSNCISNLNLTFKLDSPVEDPQKVENDILSISNVIKTELADADYFSFKIEINV